MQSFLIILAGVIATIMVRFLPFWVIKDKHLNHPILMSLSKFLPAASISLLIVYVYRNVSFLSDDFYPTIIASLLVVLLHALFKNSLLSIVIGTLAYMLLI